MLHWIEQQLTAAATNPDRILKWVLIYFAASSLAFVAVWLIGYARSNMKTQD